MPVGRGTERNQSHSLAAVGWRSTQATWLPCDRTRRLPPTPACASTVDERAKRVSSSSVSTTTTTSSSLPLLLPPTVSTKDSALVTRVTVSVEADLRQLRTPFVPHLEIPPPSSSSTTNQTSPSLPLPRTRTIWSTFRSRTNGSHTLATASSSQRQTSRGFVTR